MTSAKDKKEEKEVHYGLPRVMRHILSDWNTSMLFIIYVISKAINKAISTYKTVIFLKDKNLGGLAFSSSELSNWTMFCMVPSFFILFAQPRLVPKVISYKAFIGGCIVCFFVFISLVPGLADIGRAMDAEDSTAMRVIMMINFMFMNLFTAKLFIPAMNVLLNLKMEKPMRAGLNSIFYLGVTFLTIALNKVNEFAMNYFFDDLVAPPSELYKYYALSVFLIF